MTRMRICKRGHVVESAGLCRECKRLRDRIFQAKKPKPKLTPEQIEEQRRKSRERHAKRMQDPEYAKVRSKRVYDAYVKRITEDPALLQKHRDKIAKRWQDTKADPAKLDIAREQSRESSRRYRHKQFDRPDPKLVAAKAKAKVEAIIQQARMGVQRVAYL